MIVFANVFVYFIHYEILDWTPTFLQKEKGFSIKRMGWAYPLYEYAAIPGTILCDYISDKVFNDKRSPAGILFIWWYFNCSDGVLAH
ncbi:Glycerol-3-phosphate transporter domain protein [Candidatus Hepatincolaceae symbiont of Richtersius coronifer]